MTGMTCWYCGQGPVEDRVMKWGGDGLLAHYFDVGDCAQESGRAEECSHDGTCDELSLRLDGLDQLHDRPCPSLLPGWARCTMCQRATRADDMAVAEEHQRIEPYRSTYKPLSSDDPPPFWLRVEQITVPMSVPRGTQGLIIERYPKGGPILVCRQCSDGWPKRRAATPERDDEALAAMVPTDGPGLPIADFATLWGMSETKAKPTARRLAADGLLRFEEVSTSAGGGLAKRYWRAKS